MIFAYSALRQRIAIGVTVLCLLPSISRAELIPTLEKTELANKMLGNDETIQPKFIWGVLIKLVASQVSDIFLQWVKDKLNQGIDQYMSIPTDAAVSSPGAAVLETIINKTIALVPNVSNTTPSTPLTLKEGKENYQGVWLSLLVLQPDGQTLKVRPLSAGFTSGEKFRIRVGSTFDAELSIDNIDPHHERSHLYPARSDQVVKVKSGVSAILPLEQDSFFQFDDVEGEESLVITIRDPRANDETASHYLVNRQENEQGTGLLQEVAFAKYPAIAESISFQHRK